MLTAGDGLVLIGLMMLLLRLFSWFGARSTIFRMGLRFCRGYTGLPMG